MRWFKDRHSKEYGITVMVTHTHIVHTHSHTFYVISFGKQFYLSLLKIGIRVFRAFHLSVSFYCHFFFPLLSSRICCRCSLQHFICHRQGAFALQFRRQLCVDSEKYSNLHVLRWNKTVYSVYFIWMKCSSIKCECEIRGI